MPFTFLSMLMLGRLTGCHLGGGEWCWKGKDSECLSSEVGIMGVLELRQQKPTLLCWPESGTKFINFSLDDR